jgi:hypothetical protein
MSQFKSQHQDYIQEADKYSQIRFLDYNKNCLNRILESILTIRATLNGKVVVTAKIKRC